MKGEKIKRWLWVKRTGSACIGLMSMETAYVAFNAGEIDEELIWHSDHAEDASFALKEGQLVYVDAFKYGDHLRRVTVKTEDGKVFGVEYWKAWKEARKEKKNA